MERREKIQGFIKKYIILKKRKPTDSIFAEKRSAVAITFALMAPIFFGMFSIAIDLAFLYYENEILSMGSDAASTVVATTSYFQSVETGGPGALSQFILAYTFCQAPPIGAFLCPGGYNYNQPYIPSSVSQMQFLAPFTWNGTVVQVSGWYTFVLNDFLSNWIGSYYSQLSATSVVRYLY